MADFTSPFWSWFIIVLTLGGIAGMFILNRWMTEPRRRGEEKAKSIGHVWDEDLHELNNPLPRWWLNLFYVTLVFGVIYLLLYPGLGGFAGALGWTQLNQYEREMAAAAARYDPIFEQYLAQDIPTLARDPAALRTGERLFVNYCASCHGSDARGARGFPNLRDGDWLWGGDPESIKASILDGRTGIMPAWGAVLGPEGVRQVAEYVLELAGRRVDDRLTAAGRERYQQLCVACHGPAGKGNPALGAPDLTNDIWVYGGTRKDIMESIEKGRTGRMPAHRDFLGEARVHVLAAYVYSLAATP